MANPTRKKAKRWLVAATALAVFLGLVEVGLRLAGHGPWEVRDLGLQVEPGGKLFAPHPTLGYVHLPGRYRVTLPTGYSFTMTHSEKTLRITHPPRAEPDGAPRDEIWIFGCSFTHGWSVNDEETYPWLLQQQMPDKEVVNFGVSGYGTVHSLIQFREALRDGRAPVVAVVAYAAFHDERNTFSRSRRKYVVPWSKFGRLEQPCARLDGDGKLSILSLQAEYDEFPLMRYSATIHFVEQVYDALEFRWLRSHDVSKALLVEFARECAAAKARLVVAGIARSPETAEMVRWCKEQGIVAGSIAVDITESRYNNLPHDSHPNGLAHAEYARKLGALLHSAGCD